VASRKGKRFSRPTVVDQKTTSNNTFSDFMEGKKKGNWSSGRTTAMTRFRRGNKGPELRGLSYVRRKEKIVKRK